MKLHGSAKLSPASRLLLVRRVDDGWSVSAVSASLGVSQRTVFKWLRRFRDGGKAALLDRSSPPTGCPHQTSMRKTGRILRLRGKRLTAWEIAAKTKLPRSTVSRVLSRHGLGQLKNLDPKEPTRRYEKKRPGQLLHLDIKKLGRFDRPGHRVHGDRKRKSKGAGWECAHVAVDDCTRLAYAEVLPNEKKETVADFLTRAKRFYSYRSGSGNSYGSVLGAQARSGATVCACEARRTLVCAGRSRTSGELWRVRSVHSVAPDEP